MRQKKDMQKITPCFDETGNNPEVSATVAPAVAVYNAMK